MIKSNNSHQQKLCRYIKEGKIVWVLYLDIVKFHEVEFRYGYKVCHQILNCLEKEIENTLDRQRQAFHFTGLESRGGDDFVVYLVPGKETPFNIADLEKKWVMPLEDRFNRRLKKLVGETIHLRSGIVRCTNELGPTPDYALYAATKEALLLNKSEHDPHHFARREEITRLLDHPGQYLRTAFQPILDVQTGEIYGFEALSRILGESHFSNIADLFPFAEKIGQLYAIETLCRRSAIQNYRNFSQNKGMLFLNINPQVLSDPEFASGHTRKMLSDQGLSPSNVVLEITERSAIADFNTFRSALGHYRNQGFLIALDDVGAGYSSMQSIAELHPDFLKVDRSLINGVNNDPIKWALLEMFITFSKRIGCRVIAEGVETAEEMRTIVQLGADYIQGFFIARPAFTQEAISQDALDLLKTERRAAPKEEKSIRSFLEPLPLFELDTQVGEVEAYFRGRPNQWLAAAVEKGRVIGAIHRDKLFAALGTRYGVPLYSQRSIALLVDRNPLIVEDTTPIEVVSSIAMDRPDAQLYDGIIVTNQQKPIGMVSVATLMKAMAERQIQMARGANPLTGLPGNLGIDQEICRRIERHQSFAVLYADLNQFKKYNDLYGYQRGDQVIKMLGDVLFKEADALDKQAFVGHIGGDDFLVVLSGQVVEGCASAVIRQFALEAEKLVGAQDLSVALAGLIVDAHENPNWTPNQVAEKAAQLKRQAKMAGGNAFVLDQGGSE